MSNQPQSKHPHYLPYCLPLDIVERMEWTVGGPQFWPHGDPVFMLFGDRLGDTQFLWLMLETGLCGKDWRVYIGGSEERRQKVMRACQDAISQYDELAKDLHDKLLDR